MVGLRLALVDLVGLRLARETSLFDFARPSTCLILCIDMERYSEGIHEHKGQTEWQYRVAIGLTSSSAPAFVRWMS